MVHRRVDLVPIGDIGYKGRCFPADAAHLVGDLVHLGLVEVDNRDAGSVDGQTQRDAASDSLARAGDQCDFALDAHRNVCLLLLGTFDLILSM